MDAAKTLKSLKNLAALQQHLTRRVAAWEQTHGAAGEPEPAEPAAAPAEPAPGPTFANNPSTGGPQM